MPQLAAAVRWFLLEPRPTFGRIGAGTGLPLAGRLCDSKDSVPSKPPWKRPAPPGPQKAMVPRMPSPRLRSGRSSSPWPRCSVNWRVVHLRLPEPCGGSSRNLLSSPSRPLTRDRSGPVVDLPFDRLPYWKRLGGKANCDPSSPQSHDREEGLRLCTAHATVQGKRTLPRRAGASSRRFTLAP